MQVSTAKMDATVAAMCCSFGGVDPGFGGFPHRCHGIAVQQPGGLQLDLSAAQLLVEHGALADRRTVRGPGCADCKLGHVVQGAAGQTDAQRRHLVGCERRHAQPEQVAAAYGGPPKSYACPAGTKGPLTFQSRLPLPYRPATWQLSMTSACSLGITKTTSRLGLAPWPRGEEEASVANMPISQSACRIPLEKPQWPVLGTRSPQECLCRAATVAPRPQGTDGRPRTPCGRPPRGSQPPATPSQPAPITAAQATDVLMQASSSMTSQNDSGSNGSRQVPPGSSARTCPGPTESPRCSGEGCAVPPPSLRSPRTPLGAPGGRR